jgi:hypothetical protein
LRILEIKANKISSNIFVLLSVAYMADKKTMNVSNESQLAESETI